MRATTMHEDRAWSRVGHSSCCAEVTTGDVSKGSVSQGGGCLRFSKSFGQKRKKKKKERKKPITCNDTKISNTKRFKT